MKIHIVGITDIGNNREQNEDAFSICPNLSQPNWGQCESYVETNALGSLLIVADGMGGANAGDVASNCAIKTLQEQFTTLNVCSAIQNEKQIVQLLTQGFVLAHEAINDLMVNRPETAGMGTTIVTCWLFKDKAYIAWCGDSRCYVYNNNYGLKVLTKDHSLVQEMIDKGDITEEEALHHPDNNIITRGLGDFDSPPISDVVVQPIKPNDIILLCTDGLCGYCNNQTIEKTIENNRKDLHHCCNALLDIALKHGSEDNITIVLASLSEQRRKFSIF